MKKKQAFFYFFIVAIGFFYSGSISIGFSQETNSLRLNQIRILASHNSYKKKPDPRLMKFLAKVKDKIGEENDPIQLEYGHELLSTQLSDYMVRGFELDIYYDPKGGKFPKRKINSFVVGLKTKSKEKALKTPGFKVLHIADIDYETNYLTLEAALSDIRDWSIKHPLHCPLFINLEVKSSSPADVSKFLRWVGFKRAAPFTPNTFHLLDSLIEANFSQGLLFSPSEMKKNYTSLRERINLEGWPLLSECRGKTFFILEGDNVELYTNKAERPIFLYGDVSDENVVFLLRNDPIGNEVEINKLTTNYIVRTRSDAGTLEARKNDYSRFNAALKSNAQIISTDYYKADPAIGKFAIQLGEEFLIRKE